MKTEVRLTISEQVFTSSSLLPISQMLQELVLFSVLLEVLINFRLYWAFLVLIAI